MTVSYRKKFLFATWFSYLESTCQSLFDSGYGPPDDMKNLYGNGIRLTLSVMFSRIAELLRQPPERFISCFLQPDAGAELEAISFPLSGLPAGIDLDLFPDPELPGRFYGVCLDYCLKKDKRGKIRLAEHRSRRKSGAFYTPEIIARYIARSTIDPLLESNALDDIYKLKICDPAMGTGNFLSAAGKYLLEIAGSKYAAKKNLFEKNENLSELATRCLYGADRDPVAVLIARAYFAVWCGVDPDRITNFVVADSLLDSLPFNQKFDAVIGNPPWVTFGLRDVSGIPDSLAGRFRSLFPHSAEYKISVYALFIEKALSLTRTNGFHGYIVPDSWLAGRFFTKLRSFLLEKTVFKQLVLIQRDFWEGLNVGRSVIYIVQKKDGMMNGDFQGAIISAPEFFADVEKHNVTLSVERILKRKRSRIVIYPDKLTKEIVERMEDHGDILGNHIRFYSGLIGRKGKDSIVISSKPADFKHGQYSPLIESGKHLDRHSLTFNNHYIKHEAALYKSGYDVRRYIEPKIFVNQTGYRLKACYDDRGFFCLNNLHIGYPQHDNADLRFYAVLMNSRVMNFYYKTMSMEKGRALAQTDIDFLHELPLGADQLIYMAIVNKIDEHFSFEVRRLDSGAVRYGYALPLHIQNDIETLLEEWYGVKLDRVKGEKSISF